VHTAELFKQHFAKFTDNGFSSLHSLIELVELRNKSALGFALRRTVLLLKFSL
jgi:hypothetical protein